MARSSSRQAASLSTANNGVHFNGAARYKLFAYSLPAFCETKRAALCSMSTSAVSGVPTPLKAVLVVMTRSVSKDMSNCVEQTPLFMSLSNPCPHQLKASASCVTSRAAHVADAAASPGKRKLAIVATIWTLNANRGSRAGVFCGFLNCQTTTGHYLICVTMAT